MGMYRWFMVVQSWNQCSPSRTLRCAFDGLRPHYDVLVGPRKQRREQVSCRLLSPAFKGELSDLWKTCWGKTLKKTWKKRNTHTCTDPVTVFQRVLHKLKRAKNSHKPSMQVRKAFKQCQAYHVFYCSSTSFAFCADKKTPGSTLGMTDRLIFSTCSRSVSSTVRAPYPEFSKRTSIFRRTLYVNTIRCIF